MSEHVSNAKAALRQQIRQQLHNLRPEQRAAAAAKACALLESQAVWSRAQSVLFYAPLPDEPDVWRLLQASHASGKTVALPRFDPATGQYVATQFQNAIDDVVTGPFGIREPAARCPVIALNRLDLVLVPGVAFDLVGHRLGRGKGFYDRLLESVRGTICGVAFDEQIVAEVPVEPHDIRLHCILTPTRWIEP
jgi:5-formyltetrahydrofolate cyclo-ligase